MPRYIFCQSRSTSVGSSPTSRLWNEFAIACELVAEQRVDGLGRRVDLADAGDALVRVDLDDEIVLAAVGDPVVQHGLAQDDGLDVGDLQTSSCRVAGR